MTETTINYRDSALVGAFGGHRHGAARAGEHAPDPDGLLRPDGTPVTVEELLTEPGLLLLVRSGDAAAVDELRRTRSATSAPLSGWPGSAPTLRGRPRATHRPDYGLGAEGIALIRPDGYLGLVADTADAGASARLPRRRPARHAARDGLSGRGRSADIPASPLPRRSEPSEQVGRQPPPAARDGLDRHGRQATTCVSRRDA